jgi:hypothetical protein
LAHFTCAPAGHIEEAVVERKIDIRHQGRHGFEALQQRRQPVFRGRLRRNGRGLLGTVRLAGVLCRLEQRWCRFEHPRDPRSMGLFRRLVPEALPKIAVENGGPNLKQKVGASL